MENKFLKMNVKKKHSESGDAKRIVIIAVDMAVILCFALLSSIIAKNGAALVIVAMVGDEPIYYDELKLFINKIKLRERDILIKKSEKDTSDFQWGDIIFLH